MFNSLLPLPLLLLLPTALPTPILHPHRPRELEPRGLLPGSCHGSHHYPTEEAFIWGYKDFCTKYLQRDGTVIEEDKPIVFTYNLAAGDGGFVPWIFRNAAVDHVAMQNQALTTNTSECLERFGQIIESNVIGGMGKAWCVVDNTGGDGFLHQEDPRGQSGEGKVLVWGGKVETGYDPSMKFGQFEWEARRRKG